MANAMNQLANYIRNHGNQAQIVNGMLMVFDSQWDTVAKRECGKWIVVAPTWRAVRIWLGY